MEMDKYRSRTHLLILYPENESHMKALDRIQHEYLNYAYILHDKDLDDDGNIKKFHYHVMLRTKNATWNTAISKDLGITPNYMQCPKNVDDSLLYLMHEGTDSKYQYDIEEVKGTMKKDLQKLLLRDNTDENERAIKILDIIDSSDNVIKISSFSRFVASEGLWSDFRRASSIYLAIIAQHNEGIGE